MARNSHASSDHPVVFYEQLNDIINEVPSEILNPEDEGDDNKDEEIEDEKIEEKSTEDEEEDGSDEGDDDGEDEEEDEDNDDYFTTSEEDEEEPKKPAANAPVPPADVTQNELGQFILANLTKIPVNILVQGKDGEDIVERVEVYGYGDLPVNFKGYANPREGELFRGAVTAQELKAQNLQTQFNQKKELERTQQATEEYTVRENKAIADDLTELRKEGLFPKFKGNPGTKEFNESEGAKEFDKVVTFMNKKNDEYVQRANAGKNYRHIGFRESFEMLHGPNPKAGEQAEDKARKKIAGKVVSKRGTRAQTIKSGAARVNNMTDLADEFISSMGSN